MRLPLRLGGGLSVLWVDPRGRRGQNRHRQAELAHDGIGGTGTAPLVNPMAMQNDRSVFGLFDRQVPSSAIVGRATRVPLVRALRPGIATGGVKLGNEAVGRTLAGGVRAVL